MGDNADSAKPGKLLNQSRDIAGTGHPQR